MGDTTATNLNYFHQFMDVVNLPGEFTKVRKLADGIHGKVYLYNWRREDTTQQLVVAKLISNQIIQRIRESRNPNDRQAFVMGIQQDLEDCVTEIGVYQFLHTQPRCQNLLYCVGCKRDDSFTWLLTEYDHGEELFGVVQAATGFDDADIRDVFWQLLQAVEHLHNRNIGHRDISLENVLCRTDAAGRRVCQLMDFGQAVQLNAPDGAPYRYRYFNMCAKDYYRAPEIYIPRLREGQTPQVPCPADYVAGEGPRQLSVNGYLCEWEFSDGAVPSQPSSARPAGYTAAPADMFALGVALFILKTRLPPWSKALLADRTFTWIQAHGAARLFAHWGKEVLPTDAMLLLGGLIDANPATRWGLDICRDSAWFADLR